MLIDQDKKKIIDSVKIGGRMDVQIGHIENQDINNTDINSESGDISMANINMEIQDPESAVLLAILEKTKNRHYFQTILETTPYTKFKPR